MPMTTILRRYWRETEGYQKLIYLTGFLLLASAVFHVGVLLITGGSLSGNVSFRKAVTFGESFGVTALSLVWFMSFTGISKTTGWILSVSLTFAIFCEVFLVTMQVWRGVPSHFNFTTPFDATVFGIMGIMISIVGVVILVIMIRMFTFLKVSASYALSLRIGVGLLFVSQLIGIIMIVKGGNTFGANGVLTFPHALGLHGAQVVPFLGWILMRKNLDEKRQMGILFIGASGYVILFAISAFQAFTGVGPLDLGVRTWLVVLTGVGMLAGAYGLAIISNKQMIMETHSGTTE